jgi:hypothetical protein
MAHVFISYVREDRSEVDRLAAKLTSHGVDVWLDRDQIKPGTFWKDAIRDAIRRGNLFIACFSANSRSRDRTYMNTELSLAIDVLTEYPTSRAWFIPVLFAGGEVPDRTLPGGTSLRDIQQADLGKDWDRGVDQILKVALSAEEYAKERVRTVLLNLTALVGVNETDLRSQVAQIQEREALLNAIDAEISAIEEDNERLARTRLREWRDPHYRLEWITKNHHDLDQLRHLRALVAETNA